jgi:hypothetical protein
MRDLCPQTHHSVSLCDALDRALNTGVVALGEVTISVADIDLLYLGLQLVITSIETGREPGRVGDDWPEPGRVVRGGPQAEWAEPAGPDSPPVAPASSPLPAPPALGVNLAAPRPLGHPRALAAPRSPGQAPEKNGLGQLVLTLIKVLHELLKRQALRRMEAGSLSIAEMERLGATLMRQAQEIERMAKELGLELEDLNLDLGPLGKLL